MLKTHIPRFQIFSRKLKVTTIYVGLYVGKGKGFPMLDTERGPRADPGVQAVSPQVTVSHPPGGRLPLFSTMPPVTSLAAEHHRPLAGTKLYCLVTEAHRCEQLAQGCYAALPLSMIWTRDLLIASPTLYPLHYSATLGLHAMYLLTNYDRACVPTVELTSVQYRQHLTNDECLDHKNCSVLYCILQLCTMICWQSDRYEQFLQLTASLGGLGLI